MVFAYIGDAESQRLEADGIFAALFAFMVLSHGQVHRKCLSNGAGSAVQGRYSSASGVSFKVTDPVGLLLAGFEGKEQAVGMILADIFKTSLHRLEADRFTAAPIAFWFFRHDHVISSVPTYIFLMYQDITGHGGP